MDSDRENPSPLARLPGGADANWHDWSPELETAYLQHIAGVDRLEDATSLQLVVNTAAGGSVAHLGAALPNLLELNLNGSTLDSLRDLGTGFRLLQVLWVSRCGLKALDGLNGLPSLRELYAAYNDITDLQPVDCCTHLEILDVECNCIPDTDAVLYLTSCSYLQTLTLAGNPASQKPGYRQAVIATLPSLHSLDDEPVTPADRNQQHHSHPQQPGRGDGAGSRSTGGGGGGSAGGSNGTGSRQDMLPPPPLRAAAVAAFGGRSSLDAGAGSGGGAPASPAGSRAGGGGAAAAAAGGPPDEDEIAFVVAGIKHARVGVDSHEFREIEMNLLVATADGTEVQLDVRPGTSTLLPASASTWVRTLRSSREGSLAALRAAAASAASSAAARTGSQSPTSPFSASPISSRPPSSQQQRGTGGGGTNATAAPVERWAMPAGPGAALGMPSSFGSPGTAPSTAGGSGARRPSSGTGILSGGGGGGAGPGGMGGTVDSPMRPGSGGYRLGTGGPYSARPGTAASFSARMGTSASTGAAPASASAGLYWAKNRISGGSATGGGNGGGGGGADSGAAGGVAGTDADAAGSKLTQGSDTTFGGSFARDLRKWKGAAVRAAAAAVATSGGDVGVAAAAAAAAAPPALGGGNGLSSSLLRNGQLDPKALLEELKRWKLETADKVLFVDPDEAASGDGWMDGLDRGAGSSCSGGGAADILRLTSSQDGAAPELAAAFGLSVALLEQPPSGAEAAAAAAGAAYSPVPGSPLQPPRPPPGAVAAGRRKMVLAKVLRDIAADTISSSGVCISEILAGLRPVHAPPVYGSGGAGGPYGVPYTPGVAWGPPGSADSSSSRERERSGGSASASTTPTSGHHHNHHNHHHHNHHHHNHHGHSKYPHGQHSQQQQQQYQQHQTQHQQQYQQQQGSGGSQRGGSARSVCSSSGQSDYGPQGPAGQSSRPGSREEQAAAGGPAAGGGSSSGGGGPQLQRQRSASRAPGLPPGPSAPTAATAAAYRAGSTASDVDMRPSNPSPGFKVAGW